MLALAGVGFAASRSLGSSSVKGKTVVLVDGAPSDPYIAAFNRIYTEALTSQGVKVSTLSNNFDATVEEQKLNEAISLHPSLIAVGVQDPVAVAVEFAAAKAAGIKVVIVVNPADAAAVKLSDGEFVDNNPLLGKFAAINLQQGLAKIGVKSGRVVVITGSAGQLTTQERLTAFTQQLATTPGFKIVSVQDGEWDPVLTATIASQLFAKYRGSGGIQAAYGMADLQAAAIATTAQKAGLPVGVKAHGMIISGSNCGPVGIKAIRAGTLYGGATQAPTVGAAKEAQLTLEVLRGQKTPKIVLLPEARITAANVNKYAGVCTY